MSTKKVFILLEYSETHYDIFFKKKFEHTLLKILIKINNFLSHFFKIDKENSERDQFFSETRFRRDLFFSCFEEEKKLGVQPKILQTWA